MIQIINTISTPHHGPAGANAHTPPTEFAAYRKPTYAISRAARDLGVLAGRLPEIRSIWGGRSVSPAFRESLMVSVARYNGCRYCAFAHVEWAVAEDVSDEELAALAGLEPEDFDRGQWIAYAWANELVASGFGSVSEELGDEMSARYSPGEILQLDTIVRVMTLMNLSGNTLDALLSRGKGRPAPGSHLVDELVIGGTFAAGMLPIGLYLSAKRRKSPVRLVRDLIRFSTRFEGSAAS